MKAILQIFTGGWKNANYTALEILGRLEEITAMMPVEKVILGWRPDPALYRQVGEFLARRNIGMLLWLPVLSEIGEWAPADPALDLWGRPISVPDLLEGESFSFCCPTSPRNQALVRELFQSAFADCGFTGVFLDRIRTHSFVGGVPGVLSCGCPSCRAAYARHGVELPEVAEAYERLGDRFFDLASDGVRAPLAFSQPPAQAFFRAKAAILEEQVGALCDGFHRRGLEVGLDLFAPTASLLVGQDYPLLARHADFIKPMLYRRTNAPAGMVYEGALWRRHAPGYQGLPALTPDNALLRNQIRQMEGLPCRNYPGIEVNYRADVAPTDPDYIRESLAVLEEEGCDGAVLAWDVMLAPREHLQAIGECLG